MIQTYGLLRAISRIADMELRAYQQSASRIDFSNREADVAFEIHHDGVHAPSLEIALTHDGGTHRLLVPRSHHPGLPADGEALAGMLRMIGRASSLRSDPTSSSLRRRYEKAMRFASLFPDGIATRGGRAALDLIAATPMTGVRVAAQTGYDVRPEALRLISDFIPHGRTTRALFQSVRGMTRTWEIGGLQTPIGIVEPVSAVERLRITADLMGEFHDDPWRLELIRQASAGGTIPTRMAA